jgi:hypothetical protein
LRSAGVHARTTPTAKTLNNVLSFMLSSCLGFLPE